MYCGEGGVRGAGLVLAASVIALSCVGVVYGLKTVARMRGRIIVGTLMPAAAEAMAVLRLTRYANYVLTMSLDNL